MFDRYFSIGLGGDAGGDFALCESLAEPVGVVALVGEEFPRPADTAVSGATPLYSSICPSLSSMTSGRPLPSYCMQLAVQAALGAAICRGGTFFKRLAAVRCALRCVASIMIRPGLPPLRASSAKILLNTPRRLQRINRL